ncbi:MAG: hypothetical protein ACJATI_001740 [Halioglobus sp.]|jgi:hypothetical protein
MLGKLKRVLGIEGVKVEMNIKMPIDKKEKVITGNLKFTTKSESVVKGITVKIVEKYSRGRGKDRLVDEYTIAQLELTDSFVISPEEIVEVPFSIMYEIALSEMDKMAKDNIVKRPFISFAKFLRKVKSEFRLVAEADVDGTTLSPFAKEMVEL